MHSYFQRPTVYRARLTSVFDAPDLTLVIPSFREPNIIDSLQAIAKSSRASAYKIHLIIVLNHASNADVSTKAQNEKTRTDIIHFISANQDISIDIIEAYDLTPKKAGVGLARKIGLDEAAYRYHLAGVNGTIACFDADSECSLNYVSNIVEYFRREETMQAVSIYYEHRLGREYTDQIINYELHLRLYIDFQKYIGLPFAYHTVGSSMAIKSEAYISKGGMNTKKAGEDFYFLHKFIEDGKCGELSDCAVYPSGRISDRVPFGTGRAILEMSLTKSSQYYTYNPQSYLIYQHFIEGLEKIYDTENICLSSLSYLHPELIAFLVGSDFIRKLKEIKANTKSFKQFKKRFYKRFNAFYFMKYLHHMRDNAYQDIDVVSAAKTYYTWVGIDFPNDAKSILLSLRELDRQRS